MKFCASSGGGEELERAFTSLTLSETRPATRPEPAPVNGQGRPSLPHRPSDTHRPNDLPIILMAMRKLREGILGSRRRDDFAQRAYMFIIHASILTKQWESYQPALLHLIHGIHSHTPLSIPEIQEFVGYHILDLACRQNELVDAFAVKLAFRHRDRKVSSVLKSVVHDDWPRFWRVSRAVDGYQRAITEFAGERIRLHALKCLARSYMNVDKAYVERTGNASWEDLVKGGVGWQLQDSGNVLIKKPRPK